MYSNGENEVPVFLRRDNELVRLDLRHVETVTQRVPKVGKRPHLLEIDPDSDHGLRDLGPYSGDETFSTK